ncbi:hypothetical protein X726_32335 [Mesorhizobium sp. L103C105A0]|nr:hypothetical protein X726_32335 [Mesorhizobium sp. L103C105A0]
MLQGDEAARQNVDRTVLIKKAFDWRYERERRLLVSAGRRTRL